MNRERRILRGNRGARIVLLFLSLGAVFSLTRVRARELAAQDIQPLIADERPGGVAERVYAQYTQDPDVTLASYAAMKFPGCSGTMIGPNVLLTAAHCGASASIKFRVYKSSTLMATEIFNCSYLVRTRPDTDLLLEYCAPNAAGQNPGDKYGYLDLDIEVDHGRFNYSASRERADRSRAVYSVWWNPISNLGNVEAMLYSEGTVTSFTDAPHWYNPNRTDPCGPREDGRALGVEIDMWSNGGASGSSHLSRDRHRILHGPLSVGQTDGRGRGMLSIADYLFWGRVFSPFEAPCGDSNSIPQLNAPFMESLGLDPENYTSWVDANLDGIFDVQKDLETLLGNDNKLMFRATAPASGAYLVDNVTVERR